MGDSRVTDMFSGSGVGVGVGVGDGVGVGVGSWLDANGMKQMLKSRVKTSKPKHDCLFIICG